MEISDRISQIKKDFSHEIEKVSKDELFVTYLGKKGVVNTLLAELKEVTQEEKVARAKEINALKTYIQEQISNIQTISARAHLTHDLTIPVRTSETGQLHPITIVSRQLNEFFHYYGFSVFDGPEIEDDLHNFDILGVPQDHPARELQDTLYVLEPDWLLRTQTSSIEARELVRQDPPIRFVFGGKAFRNETASKSNGSFFHQYQGVCVDKNITMGHLKWMFEKSLKFIFGNDVVIRFRAKYYPEVEPGMSPDIQCMFCKGEGCEICKNRGWIEIAGGGMIHPATLKKANINPKEYSGFAFGWGLDRVAMARFDVRDLRLLLDGSIVYKE